jgi:signal transduction histidine kinase
VVKLQEKMNQPPRVLIIDDEEAARYGMRRALANQGYELEEARDGCEALERILSFHPDAVISDINMPGMDGITLLRTLQEREKHPVVVLVTAYGSESVAVEALRAGAYDYLSKPFEIAELRSIMKNALDRQRLIEQNRQYAETLRKTCQELQHSQATMVQAEKMTALAGLVAGIAHEINNPLGALQSSTDTIRRAAGKLRAWIGGQTSDCQLPAGPMLEVLTDACAQAQLACARIDGVVYNLLQFAQLDRADWRSYDVREGLESALKLLEPEIAGKVDVQRGFGTLPEIVCRARDINQLFFHLLQNAAQAVVGTGRRGTVSIAAGEEDGHVLIEIIDNGCGIPEQDLQRIFDPGFTTKGVRVGSGLGLAICYQIVKAHNGRIMVESKPGEGSRFRVLLPVRRPGSECS